MTVAEAWLYCGLEVARYFTKNPAVQLYWNTRAGGVEYWLCWAKNNEPIQCAIDPQDAPPGTLGEEWVIPTPKGRRFLLMAFRRSNLVPIIPYGLYVLVKREDGTFTHIPMSPLYICDRDGPAVQDYLASKLKENPSFRVTWKRSLFP